jgi:ribosome biogenesis GTPase / thiamine phosphate phosphatase
VTTCDPPLPLESLGWDSGWSRAFTTQRERLGGDVSAARVTGVDRGSCTVLTGRGPTRATFGGPVLERMAADATHAPCTGDWCVLRSWPDGPVTMEALLPRRSSVVRADTGGSSRGQVLVANVDLVAAVFGLVPEPTMGRVVRLVSLAWSNGATPLVVLTKTDLVGDGAQIAADVRAACPGVQVLVCSAVTGEGIDDLRAMVTGNRTLALLGSSGAGKSSLVNTLAGSSVLKVREIRDDGKGRHTSVRRELVPLPGGGAVIDTPGLRGIGLIDAEPGLAATFSDIERLAGHCRFNDCTHTAEPGCAVLEAVNDGALPVRRLESWRKLRRELDWMAARSDARLRAERAKVWKRRSKEQRRRHRSG